MKRFHDSLIQENALKMLCLRVGFLLKNLGIELS